MNTILLSLENILGPSKKSSSTERLFHCPLCNWHKPKLSINFGSRAGYWKCWVCGEAGRKISSLLYKLGYSSREVYTILDGYDQEQVSKDAPTPPRTSVLMPTDYRPLWDTQHRTWEYNNALMYLIRRGVTMYDVCRYQLGYCEAGPYKNRIIIPSFDKTFKLNYFVSRCYYDSTMKYKLPDCSKNVIVFENLINWHMPIVLTEGVFDAITIKRNSIPLLGKFLPNKLTQTLIEKKPPMVYVMLDEDARPESIKIEQYLRSLNINVKLVIPTQKDSSEMGFEQSWDTINKATESSFVDIITSKLYAR